jgi:hypothetical protein
LSGVELRALRRLKRDQEPPSPFVLTSERGAPFTTAGWRKMVVRLGVVAKLGFKAHPHMFRHACGFQLANQGTGARTLQAEGAYFARHLEEARRQGRIGHVAVDPISGSCTLVVGQREVENPPLRGLCAPSGRDARLAEQALARSKLSSQVSADLHQLRREWQTMLAPN